MNRAQSGQPGANGVGNASGSLHRDASTEGSRNGNGNAGFSGAAVSGGGTSGQWTGPEHAVSSDDPIDSAAPGSEKLGRLQFNISYDFEVGHSPLWLSIVMHISYSVHGNRLHLS